MPKLKVRQADTHLGDLASRRSEHHAGGQHLHHLGSRAPERLELAQRSLVQRVESRLCLSDDGLRGRQILAALLLEGGHFRLWSRRWG